MNGVTIPLYEFLTAKSFYLPGFLINYLYPNTGEQTCLRLIKTEKQQSYVQEAQRMGS